MMREAESHAEEDRKRKEEIETRNHADQAVYAAEKMLKDAGDKLSASDRQPIESAIEELKKAIEKNDVAEMKRTMEALNSAQHRAAEAMYKNAGAGAAGGGQPGGGAPGDGSQASSTGAPANDDVHRRRGGGGGEGSHVDTPHGPLPTVRLVYALAHRVGRGDQARLPAALAPLSPGHQPG